MSTVTCMPPTSPSANSKEALSVSRWRGQFPSSSLPFFSSLYRNELPATSGFELFVLNSIHSASASWRQSSSTSSAMPTSAPM